MSIAGPRFQYYWKLTERSNILTIILFILLISGPIILFAPDWDNIGVGFIICGITLWIFYRWEYIEEVTE